MNKVLGAAQVITSRQSELGETIGNNKAWYGQFRDPLTGRKRLALAARLHMRYADLGFNREERLKVFSSFLERQVKSVKDLTAAEAIVLINICENTKEFANDCAKRVSSVYSEGVEECSVAETSVDHVKCAAGDGRALGCNHDVSAASSGSSHDTEATPDSGLGNPDAVEGLDANQTDGSRKVS